jgi:hypothetical protein
MEKVGLVFSGFAVFGLLFTAVGVGILVRRSRFRQRALTTQGVITNLRSVVRTSADGLDTIRVYRPTVRFLTAEGLCIEAESRTGSNPSPGRVGKLVTVRYDPADPHRFTLTSMERVSGWVAMSFILLGCLAFIMGVAITIAVTS